MAACTRVLDEDNKFAVSILHGDLKFEDERMVIGDPLTKTAACSCGMFNRTGILCGHGLKVLDLMNIKILPTHYILKRWTREARNGSIQDRQGRNVVENPKLKAQLRYKHLSHKFHSLARKVANSEECCLMLENAIDFVGPQIEDKLNATTNASDKPCNDQENTDPNVQLPNELLSAAKLKKKEVQSKNLRRKKTWLDKLLKGKRKPTKVTTSKNKGAKVYSNLYMMCYYYSFLNYLLSFLLQQQKKHDGVEPQVGVKKDGSHKGENVELQECNAIMSFTELLTALHCGVYDEDMF
jgi:zinc finger SWIM domain-containing protein 3